MTDWIEEIRARYVYYGPTDKLKPNTAVLHIRLLLEEIDNREKVAYRVGREDAAREIERARDEGQERDDEELVSLDISQPTRSDIESVAYLSGGGFLSREVNFEVEEDEGAVMSSGLDRYHPEEQK